ncbi:MAG: SurA N-terminal domain-containing protein [Pseudomonadota bacterium]
MIELIRSGIGSWAVKILFALLIASFAVWGIGDIFRDGGLNQRVGSVGDRDVTLAEIDRAFQGQLDVLRQRYDPTIEPATAIQLGALDSAIQTVVSGALIDEAASDLSLRASDEDVALVIAENPGLQGLDGRFNPRMLRNMLAMNGMTEEQYLNLTRQDAARQQVFGVAAGGITPPGELVDTIFDYAGQRRVASYILLENSTYASDEEPSSDALQAFFDENTGNFGAPEYRRLTIVTLGPENVLDQITIDEAEIQAQFESRADQYNLPERRDLKQIIVQDEALAASISEAANEAGSLEGAAETLSEDVPDTIPLLDVTQSDLLTPELGEAVFALASGTISEPIQSPFGWHVFIVDTVEEATVLTLEDVRDDLELELRQDLAGDVMFEVSNQILDARAGGATLSEVADQFGLTLLNPVPVDRSGQADIGQEAPEIPFAADVLREAFALHQGEESLLEELAEGSYFAVTVDEIIQPRDRSFEEVRDDVAEAVRLDQQATARTEVADGITARLEEGQTLAAIATDLDMTVADTEPLIRSNPGSADFPTPGIVALFEAAEPGDTFRFETPTGEIVAVLSDILSTDDDGVTGLNRDRLAGALSDALRVEINEQLSQALTSRHQVSINRDRLVEFYTSDQLGGQHGLGM